MATEPTNNATTGTAKPAPGSPQHAQVITGIEVDEVTTFDTPLRGGKGEAATSRDTGASLEFNTATGLPEGMSDAAAPAEGAEGDAAEEGADAAPEPEAPSEGSAEPLGEWKADDPEVAAKYEARYFTKEGKLNLQSVTTEFWSNAKEGKPGTLHEDTYKFLEDTLGVTKDAAKAIEAGLVAQQAQDNSKFWQRVGGKARYGAALEWGKSTYNEADKARFNKAITGGDLGARDDAIDALLARYDRANPSQAKPARRGPPQRRQASPERSVSTTASPATGGGVAAPYGSQAEYTTAFNKAINAEKTARTPSEAREARAAREKVQADGRRSQRFWQSPKK